MLFLDVLQFISGAVTLLQGNVKCKISDLFEKKKQTYRPDWKKGWIGKRKENLKKKPNSSFKITSPHWSHEDTPDKNVLKIPFQALSRKSHQSSSEFSDTIEYIRNIFCLLFQPKKGQLLLTLQGKKFAWLVFSYKLTWIVHQYQMKW